MHKIVRYTVMAAVVILGLTALIAAQNIQSDTREGDQTEIATIPGARVVGGDEAGLRELLSRLVGSLGFTPEQPVAYVGQLPDNLPFELPLPDGAHIIGSVFYGKPGHTQIILDTQQTPDEVIQFFRDTLTTSDWAALSQDGVGFGGFVSQPWTQASFCYQGDKALLHVTVQGAAIPTNVDINVIVPADTTACVGAGAGTAPGEPYKLLPQLQTPEGVRLIPNGDTGGFMGAPGSPYAAVSTVLASDLPVSKIAAAYNEQLKTAGWQLISQESGAKTAWSGWTLEGSQGKTWMGSLVLIANPIIKNQYTAQVIIEKMPSQP
jgi:hypothetical protein